MIEFILYNSVHLRSCGVVENSTNRPSGEMAKHVKDDTVGCSLLDHYNTYLVSGLINHIMIIRTEIMD